MSIAIVSEQGFLDVGDGNEVYWELTGNPAGRPAVVLHGGPGSGCGPWWSGLFDQSEYLVALMDQRGCGRSLPNAGDPETDLSANKTSHLLGDIERLREHLGIERWLVLGGSWGSTLALAYATTHPARVSELVLFSVTTTTEQEVDWVTRGIGGALPTEWERFRNAVPESEREGNLAAAYARLLADPDPSVREGAARAWCRWDDAQMRFGTEGPPDPRFEDPAFRLCFARLVTHYWSHAGWLPDGWALDRINRLADTPGALIHGGSTAAHRPRSRGDWPRRGRPLASRSSTGWATAQATAWPRPSVRRPTNSRTDAASERRRLRPRPHERLFAPPRPALTSSRVDRRLEADHRAPRHGCVLCVRGAGAASGVAGETRGRLRVGAAGGGDDGQL